MILLTQIAGLVLVALALIHVVFPKYFGWKSELSALRLVNRQMMEVHTFFIALVVFLMGLLCVTSAEELAEAALGRKISLGLAVFWGARLLVQFFWYSPALWRRKRFETCVHVVFSLLWASLTLLFARLAMGPATDAL